MISIVTITFNNFEELLKTQGSLNEVEGIERIVINGGECQKTKDWLSKQQSIIYISEPDHGISDAFSKGARLASGQAITFLNSGDVLLAKDYYHKSLEKLSADKKLSFTHSNLEFVDSIAGPLFMRPPMSPIGAGMPYFHPTMVVKSEVFKKIGYFKNEYKIAMDYEFVCRMLTQSLKSQYLDISPVVRMDGSGISATNEKRALIECYRAMKENHLDTLINISLFYKRKLSFQIRSILMFIRLDFLLKRLKKLKHH